MNPSWTRPVPAAPVRLLSPPGSIPTASDWWKATAPATKVVTTVILTENDLPDITWPITVCAPRRCRSRNDFR